MPPDVATEQAFPIWARPEAFPKSLAGWGWLDPKKRKHFCDSEAALIQTIGEDRQGAVTLVWTPENPRMILPEELASAESAVLRARKIRANLDLAENTERLRRATWVFAIVAGYVFYRAWKASGALLPAFRSTTASGTIGIALLLFLIFAFIPWYQARKNHREVSGISSGGNQELANALRFETWMERQHAPVTLGLFALIAAVGIVQIIGKNSVDAAGLVRAKVAAGEWWRAYTAPFLHGNIVHFLMNASALVYLGKRVETFARWPHVPMVFLFSALAGGQASLIFSSAPNSLGASGGLMGWLGFLLVFESRNARLVPRSSRRRLLAGIAATALIGIVGYQFIDNAAHAGGLAAGMLYAAIVFPPSKSFRRPASTATDLVIGGVSFFILICCTAFAALRILF